MHEAVKKYIAKQKSPQKEIAQQLRNLILKTFPHIKEEFKLRVPWCEGKYYIIALKDHINLGFFNKGLVPKREESFGRERENHAAYQDLFFKGDRCAKDCELVENGKPIKKILANSLAHFYP